MRLFIAVELDDVVREAIARAVDPLRTLPETPRGLRWLPPDNWHVTLQFLGEVQEAALDALRDACAQAGRAVRSFDVVFGDAGAFNPRSARALWLGVRTGRSELGALADAVMTRTEPLGFAREDRPFSAHVTLARCKPSADVRSLLPRVQLGAFAQRVERITLYRSHTSKQGASYEPLLRAPLG